MGDSVFPLIAAAGLAEGGDLHDAARNGDLAAVKARPPASTVCGSCSFALSYRRLQRLLTPGWFSGPPTVNAQDSSGYAPVCFFPSSRCSNSTLSQIRVCRCPRPRKSYVSRIKYILIFSRTAADTSVHTQARTYASICISISVCITSASVRPATLHESLLARDATYTHTRIRRPASLTSDRSCI